MAYLAREAITRAYWKSGLYSRRLQTVDGADMTDGLDLLNNLIADKTVDIGLIPFYKEYEFPTVAGTDVYLVANLVDIDTETFNIQSTRFGTRKLSRSLFFAISRQDGVRSLPTSWHPERVKGGTNIYMYPVPDEAYTIKIWGKFALDQAASLDTDLSLTYEQNYINYMIYKLAKFICDENQITFLPGPSQQLMTYEKNLNYISPIDLTVNKVSTLNTQYTMVDLPNPLFNGWVP